MHFMRLFAFVLLSAGGAGMSIAAPVSIPIDQPIGGYSNLTFGPMTVLTDGNANPPLEIIDANPLAGEERFLCGNFQFGACGANILLRFSTPLQSLVFDAVQNSELENFVVRAYSDPNAIIGVDAFDFSTDWDNAPDSNPGYGGPRRQITLNGSGAFSTVYILNTADYAAFGNFEYVPAAAVPLPAGLWFGLTGLAVLAGMRRRSKSAI